MTSYQIRLVILENLKEKTLTQSEIFNLFSSGTLGITIVLRQMVESGELALVRLVRLGTTRFS